MTVEILINVTAREARAAVVADGVLQEVLVERASRRGLLGNIYRGRVSRVLPGMQAAFVDVGLERTAFLHVSDIGPRMAGSRDAMPDIRELLHEGDDVLVQVLKDPLGTKGARLTTFIAVPSRYLVLLPSGTGIGISARITDEAERERLKGIMGELADPAQPRGCIIRTAAEGASKRLRHWPTAAPVERGDVRRLLLSRFPYKLLYAVETDCIYIMAVAHQHRAPHYWAERDTR